MGAPIIGLEAGARLVDAFDLPTIIAEDAFSGAAAAPSTAVAAVGGAGTASSGGSGSSAAASSSSSSSGLRLLGVPPAAAGAAAGSAADVAGTGSSVSGKKRSRKESGIDGKSAAGATGSGSGAAAAVVDPSLLDRPVVFIIGAMSHDNIAADYIEHTYSLSRYPLSAACAVSKLLNAYEHAWGII